MVAWDLHTEERRRKLGRSQPLRWKELGPNLAALVAFPFVLLLVGVFLIFVREPEPREVGTEDFS